MTAATDDVSVRSASQSFQTAVMHCRARGREEFPFSKTCGCLFAADRMGLSSFTFTQQSKLGRKNALTSLQVIQISTSAKFVPTTNRKLACDFLSVFQCNYVTRYRTIDGRNSAVLPIPISFEAITKKGRSLLNPLRPAILDLVSKKNQQRQCKQENIVRLRRYV